MARLLPIAGLGLLLTLALLLATVGPAAASSAAAREPASCLECHAAEGLSDGGGRDLGPHQELSCRECHQGVAKYPHEEPDLVSCLSCHVPHRAQFTGDLHAGVSCQSCHFGGQGGPHALVPAGEEATCRRCHFAGNRAGAPAAVLPAKGLLCLPCHVAEISLLDWPSRIALGIFALGLLAALGFCLGGGRSQQAHPESEPRPSLMRRTGKGVTALFLDGLLQRRLWRFSPGRGLIHTLIFWPFVLRFMWALASLVLETWWPQLPLTQILAAKNHPAHALFFDLTGLLVLAGVAAAMLRRLVRPDGLPSGLPRPDWESLGLLGGAILLGFVVEAARLAMTGHPAGGEWALVGWALSFLFIPGAALQQAYGYLWYAHVLAWCGFVAYLPFGRMFHLITAPLALALRGSEQD